MTQIQCCYKFSRCASKAAFPTIGDVKFLIKLARQLKTQPLKLQFWPLTGPLRINEFLGVTYRNNEGGSAQRGMTVFLAELREQYCWPRKSNDYENGSLNNRGGIVFIREMFCFMPVRSWIVDGHVRWSCRYSCEDWREEPGDNSKNNSLTRAKRNNSHDFHVAKWNLFRKYFWPCSHFNSELFGRLLDEVIGEGRQFDPSSENSEVFWKLTVIQTSGLSWSTRHSCLHGAEHWCTHGRKMFPS